MPRDPTLYQQGILLEAKKRRAELARAARQRRKELQAQEERDRLAKEERERVRVLHAEVMAINNADAANTALERWKRTGVYRGVRGAVPPGIAMMHNPAGLQEDFIVRGHRETPVGTGRDSPLWWIWSGGR